MTSVEFKVVPAGGESAFPYLKEFKPFIKKNYATLKACFGFAQSKSLQLLLSIALENLILTRDGGCSSKLTTRMNYVETGLLSFVGALYHFLAAAGFTLLAVCTVGQIASVNWAVRKHWLHTAIAVSSVAISLVGAVVPLGGLVATAALLSIVVERVKAVLKEVELPSIEERIEMVRSLYRVHRQDLISVLKQITTEREKVVAMVNRMDAVVAQAESITDLFSEGIRAVFHRSPAASALPEDR